MHYSDADCNSPFALTRENLDARRAARQRERDALRETAEYKIAAGLMPAPKEPLDTSHKSQKAAATPKRDRWRQDYYKPRRLRHPHEFLNKRELYIMLRPTSVLAQRIDFISDVVRRCWNHMLQFTKRTYHTDRQFAWYSDMSKQLPILKKQTEFEWLKEAPAEALQNACREVDQEIHHYLAQRKSKPDTKFPSYKKQAFVQGFHVNRVLYRQGELFIPKIGWVPCDPVEMPECRVAGARITPTKRGWACWLSLDSEKFPNKTESATETDKPLESKETAPEPLAEKPADFIKPNSLQSTYSTGKAPSAFPSDREEADHSKSPLTSPTPTTSPLPSPSERASRAEGSGAAAPRRASRAEPRATPLYAGSSLVGRECTTNGQLPSPPSGGNSCQHEVTSRQAQDSCQPKAPSERSMEGSCQRNGASRPPPEPSPTLLRMVELRHQIMRQEREERERERAKRAPPPLNSFCAYIKCRRRN